MPKTDDLETVIKLAKASGEIKLVSLSDKNLDVKPSIAAIPDGIKLRDLTGIIRAYQKFPTRPEGNVELGTIESFVSYVVRYGTANTVMFGDNETRHFEAVMNYHRLPKDAFKNIVSDLEESVVEPDWCDWSATLTLKDFSSWTLFKSYTNRDLSFSDLRKGLMSILPHVVSSNKVKDMRSEFDPDDESGHFPTFAAAELMHGVNCEGRFELVKLFEAVRNTGAGITTHLFQASMPMIEDGPNTTFFFAVVAKGSKTRKYRIDIFDKERLETRMFENVCHRIAGLTGLHLYKGKRLDFEATPPSKHGARDT